MVFKMQQSSNKSDAVINPYLLSGVSLVQIPVTYHIWKSRSHGGCRPPPQNYFRYTDKQDASIATLPTRSDSVRWIP